MKPKSEGVQIPPFFLACFIGLCIALISCDGGAETFEGDADLMGFTRMRLNEKKTLMGSQCAADKLSDGGIFHRAEKFIIPPSRTAHVTFNPPHFFLRFA